MVVQVSVVDTHYLARELTCLLGAKFDTIYLKDSTYVFRFHKGGSHDLFYSQPNWLYLGKKDSGADAPDGFCGQLRKHLSGSIVKEVVQIPRTRVIRFSLKTKEGEKFLFFEMYDKGNCIMCDASLTIVACVESQTWTNRVVAPKQVYVCEQGAPFSELAAKETLGKYLASGLGGLYAKLVCARLGLDAESSSWDREKVLGGVDALFSLTVDVHMYVKGELLGQNVQAVCVVEADSLFAGFESKSFATLSEAYAFSHYRKLVPKTAYDEKITKLQSLINAQQKVIGQSHDAYLAHTDCAQAILHAQDRLSSLFTDIAAKKDVMPALVDRKNKTVKVLL